MLRAARILGVAPWELAERPAAWAQLALQFDADERWAEEELRKRWERQRRPTPR